MSARNRAGPRALRDRPAPPRGLSVLGSAVTDFSTSSGAQAHRLIGMCVWGPPVAVRRTGSSDRKGGLLRLEQRQALGIRPPRNLCYSPPPKAAVSGL
jgi:hypothetical protein